jgi:iron complex outermembrane receptor protein
MKRFLKISLMAATAITSAPLWAQEAPADTAAEDANVIIVTARKKEETLLDAPLAVTVVSRYNANH